MLEHESLTADEQESLLAQIESRLVDEHSDWSTTDDNTLEQSADFTPAE